LNRSLANYYAERAPEYERVYEKPERQQELTALARLLRGLLADEDVLEIACGTGYWTEILAPVVRSIVATDASAEVLELARLKSFPAGRVTLELADAYAPNEIVGQFTACFAGFWWSHVPRERLTDFLRGLYQRLGRGARVVFCDNRFVEGSSTPVSRVDAAGNSYQRRRLDGGQEYEIMKNFPEGSDLLDVLDDAGAVEVQLDELRYYWCVSYRIGAVTSH
jgi:protein-L-isoaspartate O-methyltransferase